MNRDERIEQMVEAYEAQLNDLSDEELLGESVLAALRDEAIEQRLAKYRETLEDMDDDELFRGA
jgi:hypothetical protein